jgi:hypothetical protein
MSRMIEVLACDFHARLCPSGNHNQQVGMFQDMPNIRTPPTSDLTLPECMAHDSNVPGLNNTCVMRTYRLVSGPPGAVSA